jgi:hypothetical protein
MELTWKDGLAGFEVFAEKMQFAGSKRRVLVYNHDPGESKTEILGQ